MMRNPVSVLTLCCFFISGAYSDDGKTRIITEERAPDVKTIRALKEKYKWEVGGEEPSIKSITDDEVFRLLRAFHRDWPTTVGLREGEAKTEFVVRDVNNDSLYEIAATSKEFCTACPVVIFVVRKNKDKLELHSIGTMYGSVDEDLVDINGDRVMEIL